MRFPALINGPCFPFSNQSLPHKTSIQKYLIQEEFTTHAKISPDPLKEIKKLQTYHPNKIYQTKPLILPNPPIFTTDFQSIISTATTRFNHSDLNPTYLDLNTKGYIKFPNFDNLEMHANDGKVFTITKASSGRYIKFVDIQEKKVSIYFQAITFSLIASSEYLMNISLVRIMSSKLPISIENIADIIIIFSKFFSNFWLGVYFYLEYERCSLEGHFFRFFVGLVFGLGVSVMCLKRLH